MIAAQVMVPANAATAATMQTMAMVLTREEPELSHGQQPQGLYMDEATVAGIPMARHRMAPGQLIAPFWGIKLRRPKTMLVMPHTWAKRAYEFNVQCEHARTRTHPVSQH